MTVKTNPRVEGAIKSLDAGVAAVTDSYEFKRYLRFMASFHDYSWGNCMLIARQMPEATLVAGYRQWQKLGRQVRKGEKSIAILAPLVGKRENDDGEKVPHVFGFRAASVFDVSQTDGDDLPAKPAPAELIGDDAGLIPHLEQLARERGFNIKWKGDLPKDFPIKGSLTGSKIMVRSNMPPAQRSKTLIHELVHGLLKHGAILLGKGPETAELEAEGTAYVVLSHFGINTAAYSFEYLAHWAEEPDKLRSALGIIQKTAHTIIEDLTALMARKEPA